jgi:uncharacterized protein YndB with AHSA1/START domain
MARVDATGTLLAPRGDVWALVAEPHHLSDWWAGYRAVRPDRRGLAEGARWTVVRSLDAGLGLFRKPESEGLIVLQTVEPQRTLAWHDLQQGFDARIDLDDAPDGLTAARMTLEAPWLRLRSEGLRHLPETALTRLRDLCQTAYAL